MARGKNISAQTKGEAKTRVQAHEEGNGREGYELRASNEGRDDAIALIGRSPIG